MYVPKESGGVVDIQLVNKDALMHDDCFTTCLDLIKMRQDLFLAN